MTTPDTCLTDDERVRCAHLIWAIRDERQRLGHMPTAITLVTTPQAISDDAAMQLHLRRLAAYYLQQQHDDDETPPARVSWWRRLLTRGE